MPAETTTTHDPKQGGRSPEHTMELFGDCVRDGDLDRLMTLYAPEAVLQPSDGGVFEGHEAIRGYLAGMVAMKPEMQIVPKDVLVTGETALVMNEWTMRATAPDGSAVERGGTSADVLRRQPDGGWLVLIDHP